MDSESTKADVEEQLRDAADAMSDRFASLQDEVSTTSTSLREWVAQNPWKSVGGMLAAGVAVGALFGGGRSRRRREHAELMDRYIDALRAEVDEAVAAGEPPGEALEAALRDRVPLVVFTEQEEQSGSSGGLLGTGIGFVVRTIVREVVRDLILSMLEGTDVEEVLDDEIFE